MSQDNVVLARNTEDAPINEYESQTVAFSHYNNLSAQLPIDPKTNRLVIGGVKEQAIQCFENIKSVVESINHTMDDVIRISIYITNIKDSTLVESVFSSYYSYYMPAYTLVSVEALPQNALIQVEALISNGEGTIPNAPQPGDLIKLTNETCAAPKNDLSSQTVAFSHYNNLSAQLPIDPKVGRITTDCVEQQTKQCLHNIKTILTSIDVPLDDIVKMNIYVKNLGDVEKISGVYREFFPDSGIARSVGYMPARTIVPVKDLPSGALVQIEAVVSHGDGTPPQAIEDRHGLIIEASNTDKAPICPLSSQIVAFSHYNNISGQFGIHPQNEKLMEGGIKAQTEQALKNIKTILGSVNHPMEDVVKVNVYLKDINDLEDFDHVYETFFPEGTPARKVVGVGNLPHDALVLIDVIAGNPEGTPPVV